MTRSLEDTLAQARRSRPDSLPTTFADDLMARLQASAPAIPIFRPRDFAALAAVAVLVAGTISFLGESTASRQAAATPPPLTMFSDSSLFATR
ncbi:hypothetical protein [Luteolibacter soli]|uniref:Uncharacterized protein n=1 Tax=Luteolibacter soli TaxID=3135280 RepID=A0ABU9AUQ2_9BACT